jgi:hypothetical protein
MIIQVDWYREGGKWYSGGEVTIPDEVPAYEPKSVLKAIIEFQEIMNPKWHESEDYFLVVSDIPESFADRNYRMTYIRHWKPKQITAVVRGE